VDLGGERLDDVLGDLADVGGDSPLMSEALLELGNQQVRRSVG